MNLSGLGILIPDQLLVWVAIVGVGALILGAKRLGGTLIAVPALRWLAGPLVQPLVSSLPGWVVVIGSGVAVLLICQSVIALIFGRSVAHHVISQLLARWIDALIMMPFRLFRRLGRNRYERH